MSRNRTSRWGRTALLVAVVASLVLVIALPALAGDDHPKANGSVEWTNAAGTIEGIYTEFSLHDREGDDVRGSYVYMAIPRAEEVEWRWITVECVQVVGDVARWGGHITASSNAGLVDDPIVGYVFDGGTPGSSGDMIGTYANPPYDICSYTFTGGGTVTSGNLTVKP